MVKALVIYNRIEYGCTRTEDEYIELKADDLTDIFNEFEKQTKQKYYLITMIKILECEIY